MEFREIRRDEMCFACGKENPIGLKLQFHWEGDDLVTSFIPDRVFQGYPGILHGGIIGTILDDLMANLMLQKAIPVVTASMEVQYKIPVSIGQQVHGRARVVKDSGRSIDAEGELYLPDGRVAAQAKGRFVKVTHLNNVSEGKS